MEVLAHEAALLTGAGHKVEQYTLAATESLGLSPVRAGMKAVWNQSVARDVGRAVTTFRPDVMHVHTPFPLMSPVVFRVARRHGVPVSHHLAQLPLLMRGGDLLAGRAHLRGLRWQQGQTVWCAASLLSQQSGSHSSR